MSPTRPAALLLALAMLFSHASHAQAPEPPPGAAVYVDARMMTTEEVAAGFDVGNAVFGSAAGVFVAPAGLWGGVSAPPDLRGAGVAGNPYVTGTSATVVGPPVSIDFQGLQEGVRQVLMTTRFELLLRDALARRLQGARFETDPPRAIAVALAFYGVQAEEGRPQMLEPRQSFCVVSAGTISAVNEAGPGAPRAFSAGVVERSSGMEEPLCDDFSTLAESGGLRLRQLLYQSAEQLADWLAAEVLGAR